MNAGGGCSRGDQQVPVLRDVLVKNSLYTRWKPVSPESIKMVVRALEAACRFVVDTVFQLHPVFVDT